METKVAETRNVGTITISCVEYEALKAENAAQNEQIAELSQKVEWLMEQLRLHRQKRFGATSEKTDEDGLEQLSLLFNETEVYVEQEKAEPVAVAAHVRNRKSGSVKDVVPDNIPVEVVEHRLPEDELSCPICGTEMVEIGKEIRQTLEIKPAQVYLREDWYYTYACRKCQTEGTKTPVAKTPKEPALIPGSFASESAVAHIAAQKFVMGSPLYRQEQEWKRQGVKLKRQTMSNWLMRCEEDYFEPVYEELHRLLVRHQVLHADETTLQVLHEPGKKPQSKSYMWLYRTSGDAGHPIVLYEYQPDRKKEHPKEFLAGFRGYLHTDGYSGYHDLPEGITVGELAEATGLEPEDIAAADTAVLTVASLQGETGEDGFSLEAVLGDQGIEDELVEKLTLRQAIDQLPERERLVILLRFYKNLTQDRVSKVLGVSQVQVSRIERRAVARLREALTE